MIRTIAAVLLAAITVPTTSCGEDYYSQRDAGAQIAAESTRNSSASASAESTPEGIDSGLAPLEGCDYYRGPNPDWQQFLGDVQRYFDAAGWPHDPATFVREGEELLPAVPPGGAARYTTFLCEHAVPPDAESIAASKRIGLDLVAMMETQKGYALYAGLLACRPGAKPDSGRQNPGLDVDSKTVAQAALTMLCGADG